MSAAATGDAAQSAAAGRLKSLIERIERLTEDRKAIADDIKQVMAEATGAGFDGPAIKAIIKLRAIDPADLESIESMIDHYRDVLGMPARPVQEDMFAETEL